MNAIMESLADRPVAVSSPGSADAILQECVRAMEAWDIHRAANYLRQYWFRASDNDRATAETEAALADALHSFVHNSTLEQLDVHAGALAQFWKIAQQPGQIQALAEREAQRRKRDARIGWALFLFLTGSLVAGFVWSLFHRV